MESAAEESSYVMDAENAAEMARLIKQDRMFTQAMGGIFPERDDLSEIHDILDLGCGPGGWVLDVAREYPEKRIVGIDISHQMITYAQYLAEERQHRNVELHVMDAHKQLDFPDASFDLINARTIIAFTRRDQWSKLIQECTRLLRPNGVLRFTEAEAGYSTSPSIEHLNQLLMLAFYKAQFGFSPTNFGMAPRLVRFFTEAGYQDIKKRPYLIDSSAGMPLHEASFNDFLAIYKMIQPFLIKMGVSTEEELQSLYQRGIEAMQEPDFYSIGVCFTISGRKPSDP